MCSVRDGLVWDPIAGTITNWDVPVECGGADTHQYVSDDGKLTVGLCDRHAEQWGKLEWAGKVIKR